MKKKTLCLFIIILMMTILTLICCKALKERNNIPKLSLTGDVLDILEKKETKNISVTYEGKDQSFVGFAEIKWQGTSSLAYEKKNYTIKFFEDEEHEKKLDVDLGWGFENKYCLKANWIDKTHARNIVTARLVSQVQQKYDVLTNAPKNGAIDGFPIEVYINGEFHGLYTCNIPKDEWMFGMDGDNPNHIVIGGEGWEPANLFRGQPDFETWELEVGEENEETLNKVNSLFDFVMNTSDEEFKAQFENHFDVDAALNYYILTEFAFLRDNRGKNMLLATYDGQVWFPTLYDLDTSWGVDWKGSEVWEYDIELVNMSENYLFERMEACFGMELAERYFELREDILTKEHIMEEFENFEAQIPQSTLKKEIKRWGNEIPGYDKGQIEEYLDAVIDDWDQRYQELQEIR